jgi:hypothetical protein
MTQTQNRTNNGLNLVCRSAAARGTKRQFEQLSFRVTGDKSYAHFIVVIGRSAQSDPSSLAGWSVLNMPDDKSHIGEPDRSRVAGDQDYEVRYLAEKHGLSVEQARKLIDRFGNDREKLEAAARQLTS